MSGLDDLLGGGGGGGALEFIGALHCVSSSLFFILSILLILLVLLILLIFAAGAGPVGVGKLCIILYLNYTTIVMLH